MKSERTTLYFKEGSSDKIYQASLEEQNGKFIVNFAYGRRGSTLQTGTKTTQPVEYAEAKKIYDALLKSKTSKGGTPGEDGTPYAHTDQEMKNTGIHCQLLNPVSDRELDAVLRDPDFWAQEKKDGRRLLVRKDGKDVMGINRSGLAVGLPEAIVKAVLRIEGAFVLDGEGVGEVLHVFDLLTLEGKDLRGLPYVDRLKALDSLFEKVDGKIKALAVVETARGEETKRILFENVKRAGKEGMVFKHCAAPYTPGRPNKGGHQLKYKFLASASCMVAKVNLQRSVALELLNGKTKTAAGNVTIPPNADIPKPGSIIEVRYLYAHKQSGHLYQPVFLGLRDDLSLKDCTVQQLKFRTPNEDDDA